MPDRLNMRWTRVFYHVMDTGDTGVRKKESLNYLKCNGNMQTGQIVPPAFCFKRDVGPENKILRQSGDLSDYDLNLLVPVALS